MPTIVFNGKTYNSMGEMPANEREAFEHLSNAFVDKNGNGIPDFLEGDMVENIKTVFTSNININGQTYNNLDEIPPEIRAKVQGALQKLNKLGIATNIPSTMLPSSDVQTGQAPMVESRPFVQQGYSPTIEEEKGTNPAIWVLIILVLLLCVGVAAFAVFYYMYMR